MICGHCRYQFHDECEFPSNCPCHHNGPVILPQEGGLTDACGHHCTAVMNRAGHCMCPECHGGIHISS